MKFSLYNNTWHITQNKESLCGHKGLVRQETSEWKEEDLLVWMERPSRNDCKECLKIAELICRL